MPGICAEVQQQIKVPVTSEGKEDNRLSEWNVFIVLRFSSGSGLGPQQAPDLA